MTRILVLFISLSLSAPTASGQGFADRWNDYYRQMAPPSGVLNPMVPCDPVSSATRVARSTASDMKAVTDAATPPAASGDAKALREKLVYEALYGTTTPTTKSGRKVTESVCRVQTLSQQGKYKHMGWTGNVIADGASCDSQGRPSQGQCASWVRLALERAGIKTTKGGLGHAKNMGPGLQSIGMKKCDIKNPRKAPPGTVLVYGGGTYGHVEIRTKGGFVSDYFDVNPRSDSGTRPLIGAYVVGDCP